MAELAREDQRRNSPGPLAAALRGLGTGEMESLWGRLGELPMPVAVVAGSRDEKFLAIARRLVELIPDAGCTCSRAATRWRWSARGSWRRCSLDEPS